jgi:exonuclease III
MLKIATWNVNSRRQRLLTVLARHAPNLICVHR